MSGKLPGSSRRRARELALQVLYALDVSVREEPSPGPTGPCEHAKPSVQQDVQTAFEAVEANFEMARGSREFAHLLVTEIRSQLPELDIPIRQHSSNWRVERMAIVDRNILRLGAYELLQTDTPRPVILNESVDLARRFGSDSSPAFVNGILDALANSTRKADG